MTAQTRPEQSISDFVVDGPPLEGRALERYEQFRWFCGSTLVGLFTAAYIDQGMQSDISDATWATGRYEHRPMERNLRTMAAGQLVMWGDESVTLTDEDNEIFYRLIWDKARWPSPAGWVSLVPRCARSSDFP